MRPVRQQRPAAWLNDYKIEGGRTKVADGDAVYCHVEAKLPIIWKGIPSTTP